MITLNIPDMSCGHCAGVITKAVKQLDGNAVLDFDMPAHTVKLQTSVPVEQVLATLDDAGYPAKAAA